MDVLIHTNTYVCVSIYLSVCLSIYLSIYIYIYIYILYQTVDTEETSNFGARETSAPYA